MGLPLMQMKKKYESGLSAIDLALSTMNETAAKWLDEIQRLDSEVQELKARIEALDGQQNKLRKPRTKEEKSQPEQEPTVQSEIGDLPS